MRLVLSLLVIVFCAGANAAELPLGAGSGSASPSFGCTTICLDHGGSCVFGQNFDFAVARSLLFVNKRNVVKNGFESGIGGDVARWTSRYGSVTLNVFGYQQAFGGMNEAGLVAGTMHLPAGGVTRPDARPSLSGGYWVQYLLDNFATVEEVLASEATIRNGGAAMHFLVCDRSGACAVIEYMEGKRVVFTGPTLPVKALVNDTYEAALAAWRSRGPLANDPLVRFRSAAGLLADHARGAAADGQLARATDADAAAVHYAFFVLSSVSRPDTVWSAVYDTRNVRLYFTTRGNHRIREIDFAKLDFTSRTPVRMLDVRADVSGDVSERLPEYSHRESLAHSLAMAEALPGIIRTSGRMADEAVEVILGWVERFPYAD